MANDPKGAVWSRSEDVLSAEVGGEVALMCVATGQYYALDSPGSDLWRALEAPASSESLLEALTMRYQGDPARIASDLAETLDEWRRLGIVQVSA